MAKIETDEWETRAWQGVELLVPADWDIAAINGDRKQGYLRVDDGEKMPRVEVKWQESSGFVDIDGVVDKYLKEISKKRKKDEPEIEVDRDVAVVSKRRMRKQALNCFAWQGEVEGYGAAWFCEECERVMVVQVMSLEDEPGRDLAAEVIGNMHDHPEGDWLTWSTYGLRMQVPERFELSDQTLMAGRIEFHFADAGEEIVGARWGMANLALKDSSLRGWAESTVRDYHKGIKLSYGETTFRGHEAIEVTGYFSNPLRHVQSFVMHVMGKPYPEAVQGWAWFSQEENRLYYAGSLVDEDNRELAEQVAQRIACPEGDVEDADEEEPIR